MIRRDFEVIRVRLLIVRLTLGIAIAVSGGVWAEEVTHRFNGLTINANLEMAEGRDFGDGMVLLLHGYMAHNKLEIIRASQQSLLENELSSLAINLSLGIDNRHGYHGCDLEHRHVQENAVFEIAAWIAWLRERGVERVTLIGHSRGANQIMVYAVENLDPEVTHMVMLAPGVGDEIEQLYLERYGTSIDQPLARALQQIAAGKGDELMHEVDTVSCPKISATAKSFVSYYSRPNKFRQFKEYLSRSPVPTLIVAGSIDERQPNIVKLVTPYVDGKHVQVAVIEGAGHFFLDFNIEEAMEAAIEFIED